MASTPHLAHGGSGASWSFFLSGKPWDRNSEYALPADDPFGDPKNAAHDLSVSKAPADKEFLFLFDYGDEWHFGACCSKAVS